MGLDPREQPSIPTRDELYHLAYIYLIISALAMICWASFDIINRMFFEATLNPSKIKPVFLIAFVFFLGMSYNLQRKAKITLFLSTPKDEKLSIKLDDNPNRKFVEDIFIVKDDNKPKDPPVSDQ